MNQLEAVKKIKNLKAGYFQHLDQKKWKGINQFFVSAEQQIAVDNRTCKNKVNVFLQ